MKKEDLPVLKQKVLDMLPVYQADMWKTLGIDSKEGSSLVSIMLNERLIMRTRHDGHFLLEKMNGNGHEKHIDNKDLEVLKEGEDLKKDTGEVLGKKREKGVEYLKQKVLEMLPITQADMWKALDIDSSYGSRLADAMVKENLITKKRHDGSFLLEKISANGDPKVTNSENLEKLK